MWHKQGAMNLELQDTPLGYPRISLAEHAALGEQPCPDRASHCENLVSAYTVHVHTLGLLSVSEGEVSLQRCYSTLALTIQGCVVGFHHLAKQTLATDCRAFFSAAAALNSL